MASISDVAEISSCDLEMGESDSIPNGTAVADNQNTISLTFPNDTIMCPICMEGLKDPIFKLTCGHEFCKKCVSDYVVSSVSSGNSDFGCVYMNGGPGAYKMCAAKFDDETMADLLKHDAKMDKKYLRFKFLRDKKNGRECPKCEHLQLGSETSNAIICDICGNNYCYIHGGAHSGKTCEQYEDDIADETKATNDLLTQNSKSCPGCGIYVSKTAGCNHMKVIHVIIKILAVIIDIFL